MVAAAAAAGVVIVAAAATGLVSVSVLVWAFELVFVSGFVFGAAVAAESVTVVEGALESVAPTAKSLVSAVKALVRPAAGSAEAPVV